MFEAAMSDLRQALSGLSAAVDSGLADGELVELVAVAETAKRTLAAVQAEATAAFVRSVRAADEEKGVPARLRGASVPAQIALARRESPTKGGQFTGAATALAHEMPHTLAALRAGAVDEWTTTKVVEATAVLSLSDRVRVDAALEAVFTREGVSQRTVIGEASALAQQADPAAAVQRARKAKNDRRVTLRPAPDTMTYLSALLPVAEGVSVLAALQRAAKEHQGDAANRAPGDERTTAQVMADTLVERVTGRNPLTTAQPVVVNVVLPADTLLGAGHEKAEAVEVSATIPGHGPIPSRVARELVFAAAAADAAWVRRLFAAPATGRLVAVESSQRVFPKSLAEFLRLRDQRCATPFCDAPIRHLDHVVPHARGGPTTADNGQGLCERCNYTKELAGFSSKRDPVAGTTTLRTPTGHAYTAAEPPAVGHVLLPPVA